jgi:hypothetical protein
MRQKSENDYLSLQANIICLIFGRSDPDHATPNLVSIRAAQALLRDGMNNAGRGSRVIH